MGPTTTANRFDAEPSTISLRNLKSALVFAAMLLASSSSAWSTKLSAQTVAEAPPIRGVAGQATEYSSALEEYIAKVDNSFGYELAESGDAENCVWLRYNLTSQTWQGIPWKHVLWILVPQATPSAGPASELNDEKWEVDGDSTILFIAGGSWKGDWAQKPPQHVGLPREYSLLSKLAFAARAPVAIIEQVPFQPILDGRYEDEIIAETFRRYLMGEGEEWPLLLPMVKTAVRCMDVVEKEIPNRFGIDVKRFTVSGASKRGWTTWLTAAVDSRVDAFAPIVIDMLNMSKQMEHQLASWGDYSDEINDYTELNLQKYLSSPRGQLLQSIVDPYAYRELLQQPKLLIFGTNDRYWTLDACNMYWPDLKGPKFLTYTPNQGHQIRDYERLIGSLAALHRSRTADEPMPNLEWSFTENVGANGSLSVRTDVAVSKVQMWLARSTTKDFRSAVWVAQPMFETEGRGYTAQVSRKSDGYVAFYGEVVTANDRAPAYFTTNITILEGK